ncbi:MAG: hypothetical protein GQ524_03030 [Anaerolineales bacterium]|nr:hypothetical protein [Anaerolineales bacterium]
MIFVSNPPIYPYPQSIHAYDTTDEVYTWEFTKTVAQQRHLSSHQDGVTDVTAFKQI